MTIRFLIPCLFLTCYLHAESLEQIIADPEPGEYLMDKVVVLKRVKDGPDIKNEKGNWQSLTVNLVRVHPDKRITLEYYNNEVPGFEIQPCLVKQKPKIDKTKAVDCEFDQYGERIKLVRHRYHSFIGKSAYFYIESQNVYIHYVDIYYLPTVKKGVEEMRFIASLAEFPDLSKQTRPLVYKEKNEIDLDDPRALSVVED